MAKTKHIVNSTTSLSDIKTWLEEEDAIIEIASDRNLANSTFTDGTCFCKPPILLGHGCETTAERNLPIARKLNSCSSFYDTTLGKMIHLNNTLQRVE